MGQKLLVYLNRTTCQFFVGRNLQHIIHTLKKHVSHINLSLSFNHIILLINLTLKGFGAIPTNPRIGTSEGFPSPTASTLNFRTIDAKETKTSIRAIFSAMHERGPEPNGIKHGCFWYSPFSFKKFSRLKFYTSFQYFLSL